MDSSPRDFVPSTLNSTSQSNQINKLSSKIRFLKWSVSFCALIGGMLLASNSEISKYGFILLAMSSGQLLIVNIASRDRSMIFYAASLFIFVDCLGIYRWLLT